MSPAVLPRDGPLRPRFEAAEREISWRAPPSEVAHATARIAHLHDEEARVEDRRQAGSGSLLVDSGPVGALVLLLEVDRAREMPELSSVESGAEPQFPGGALVATWPHPGHGGGTLRLEDLVALARYALR